MLNLNVAENNGTETVNPFLEFLCLCGVSVRLISKVSSSAPSVGFLHSYHSERNHTAKPVILSILLGNKPAVVMNCECSPTHNLSITRDTQSETS